MHSVLLKLHRFGLVLVPWWFTVILMEGLTSSLPPSTCLSLVSFSSHNVMKTKEIPLDQFFSVVASLRQDDILYPGSAGNHCVLQCGLEFMTILVFQLPKF